MTAPTLDEQIAWCEIAQRSAVLGDRSMECVRAILATLRSVKASPQAEPVAEVKDGVLMVSRLPQGYTGPLYAAPTPAPEGWVLVPKEPTEAEIDAPRYFLSGLELGARNVGQMREHLVLSGVDFSMLPDWFVNGDGKQHLTKAGKAICIRALMLAAAPAAPQSPGREG